MRPVVCPSEGKSGGELSFVAFFVAATLATWRGATRLPAYGDIYLRDRFRCQNPTCRRRNCTVTGQAPDALTWTVTGAEPSGGGLGAAVG